MWDHDDDLLVKSVITNYELSLFDCVVRLVGICPCSSSWPGPVNCPIVTFFLTGISQTPIIASLTQKMTQSWCSLATHLAWPLISSTEVDLCVSQHYVCHHLWFHWMQIELKLMLGCTFEDDTVMFGVPELVFPDYQDLYVVSKTVYSCILLLYFF